MRRKVTETIDFFATDALGPPAEVKAGFFVSRLPGHGAPLENKEEFLRAAWKAAGFPERRPIFLKQIHSGIIYTFLNGALPSAPPVGDAVITDSREVFLVIQAADCLPVLIFDPVKKIIAGAHTGWKGSLLGLAERTVEKMEERGSHPRDMRAWLGPSIQSCCYEVDVERAVLFTRRQDKPRFIDLALFNRRLLFAAGLEGQNIRTDWRCTACGAEKFPSYRREGEKAGRIFACAALR